MSAKKHDASITGKVGKSSKRDARKAKSTRLGAKAARAAKASRQPSSATLPERAAGARRRNELAEELVDPLAEAIETLASAKGPHEIRVSGEVVQKGPRQGVRRPAGKGRTREAKPARTLRVTLFPGEVEGEVGYRITSEDPPPPRPSTAELAERMLPEAPIPTPSQAILAQRESELRWGLIEEFGALTSEQLGEQRSRAKNRHALANRWRGEGKIFAVELHGRRLYPGFQFDRETYAPEPLVARVLAALPRERMSDWETALWWVASDPWLEGRRPVDLICEDPDAVLAAAAGLAQPAAL